jgi:hypothetical protein
MIVIVLEYPDVITNSGEMEVTPGAKAGGAHANVQMSQSSQQPIAKARLGDFSPCDRLLGPKR